ncbi:MAG TPA: TIR domain-containing protein [Puia sp.]
MKILPVIIGVGVGFLILNEILSGNKSHKRKINRRRVYSNPKKMFISFPIHDKKYKDFLVAQSKNERSPFDFVDMSVKEPWTEKVWKQKCRKEIRKCDGMIALVSKNTWHSSGSRWEIKCAKEEKVPVIGMHVKKKDKGAKPPELNGKKIIDWTWDNLSESIKKF